MSRQEPLIPLSDLPDFLQDSPFLPVINLNYDTSPTPKPKPSIGALLRSKPAKGCLAFMMCMFVYVYWRGSHVQVMGRLGLSGPSCYFHQQESVMELTPYDREQVQWSEYAYSLYATDVAYLCNAVMIFESLHRLGSRADRILLYSNAFNESIDSIEGSLLEKATNLYNVRLIPVEVQHVKTASYDGPNWADSYTKLLAFNQTKYERLIVLDSDSTVFQDLDDLFMLPPSPAIMPHAYWLTKPFLSSHIMVITPSAENFAQVEEAIKSKAGYGVYDMEIMNSLFGSTCSVLPHRNYALLSGEFRSDDHTHTNYLRGTGEAWDPVQIAQDAKVVHFSDSPMPKPWEATVSQIEEFQPYCLKERLRECGNRNVWFDLYSDFQGRRVGICGWLQPPITGYLPDRKF